MPDGSFLSCCFRVSLGRMETFKICSLKELKINTEDMEQEMEVFLHYPGLFWTPSDVKNTENKEETTCAGYIGLIYVHLECFKIHLIRTTNGWIIHKTNEPLASEIVTELNAKKYEKAYTYLQAYTAHLRTLHPPPNPSIPSATYRRVVQEYREFVNFHIGVDSATLAPDLTAIHIHYPDEKLRGHALTVAVNYAEGKLFRIGAVTLPVALEGEDDSLITLYDKHVGAVQSLQHFFDTMDVVDQYTWVVHPERPTRADVVRRLILEEKVSVEITFNPEYPTEVPLVRLLGPEKRTRALERKLAVNSDRWCLGEDLLDELLKFFDMAVFPQRDSFQLSPCAICNQHRNAFKDLPEIYCPNPNCEESYHVECLYKHLVRTFSEGTVILTGKCPSCEHRIECGPPKKRVGHLPQNV